MLPETLLILVRSVAFRFEFYQALQPLTPGIAVTQEIMGQPFDPGSVGLYLIGEEIQLSIGDIERVQLVLPEPFFILVRQMAFRLQFDQAFKCLPPGIAVGQEVMRELIKPFLWLMARVLIGCSHVKALWEGITANLLSACILV
ncbi:hypothetical protein PkP19E3_33430 (plasmid) [Pseudomonas koreensis]|nr:hypothetical protein PkP19E3_33430 [Pseudomonas koreensis]